MKKIALLLVLCLVLSSMGSLGFASEKLTPFEVVLDWYPNAVHAFLYEAIDKGYFAKEGLEVTLRFPANVNDAISLVAAGKADVGLYYQQDVIMARANQQVPVKSIAAVVQRPLNIVLALADKNINSPKDLEGKTVGYAGTELSEALLKSMMKFVGSDYSNIKTVDVGFDLMSAMTTGNVDATIGCLVNHEVPQMKKEGFDVSYFNLADFGVPNYYELVFLANDKAIEEKTDKFKAFLRACKKGFDDMKNNPKEALDILLANQNVENFPLNADVEKESLDTLLPLMEMEDATFLTQTEKAWQDNIDWLHSEKLIGEKINASDVFTNALLP